ncbi:MAG: hypothetical protein NTV52_10260 [Acidobacteria bacterium]|nr:hypothetical protein [Acidobacteriota bacterium]
MTRRFLLAAIGFPSVLRAQESYLTWDAKLAKKLVLAGRVYGQVGKTFDLRIKSTDRSYNFKVRATWLTPQIIKALARLEQISKSLTATETQKLVADAQAAGEIIIQVEIDPREGSGIIPSGWVALLGNSPRFVRGTSTPKLQNLAALAPLAPRDFAYEIFWLVFPNKAEDGQPLFSPADRETELSVQIQGKVGKIKFPIPDYLRP